MKLTGIVDIIDKMPSDMFKDLIDACHDFEINEVFITWLERYYIDSYYWGDVYQSVKQMELKND